MVVANGLRIKVTGVREAVRVLDLVGAEQRARGRRIGYGRAECSASRG